MPEDASLNLRSCLRLLVCLAMMVANTFLFAQAPSGQDTILTGELSRQTLENNCPWFKNRYDRYVLNDSVVKALQPHAASLRFVLVIGTWCSDSKEHVPTFFKLTDVLVINDSLIRIHAVNRKKDRILTPEVASLNFEYVPTFFVYYDGKLIGSIVEDTRRSMELDMLEMIKTAGY